MWETNVVLTFRGYQQQDAHEFMRYLLDRLHTELLTLLPYPNSNSPYIGPKGKSTIVTTIFGGILQNEVKCLMCGMESKKHDPFLGMWNPFWGLLHIRYSRVCQWCIVVYTLVYSVNSLNKVVATRTKNMLSKLVYLLKDVKNV